MNDQQLAAERAAFEKWARRNEYATVKDSSGKYLNHFTHTAWIGYQAALAQREPEVKETLVEIITGCITRHLNQSVVPGRVIAAAREIVAKYCVQREPVAEGEVAEAWNRLDADGYHLERDILQRTEAARVAAEANNKALQCRIELLECDMKSGDYEALYAQTVHELATERERGEKLADALQEAVDTRSDTLPKAVRQALAAYQSRKESGE